MQAKAPASIETIENGFWNNVRTYGILLADDKTCSFDNFKEVNQ
jgi:hypothetical protein